MNITTRIALVALLALPLAPAMAAEPVEGKDYFRVDPAVPPADAAKVCVTEFFRTNAPTAIGSPSHTRVGLRASRGRQD